MPFIADTSFTLVVVRLLEPINNALRQQAAERLANGITHDDGRGGITNLLGFIDDISTVVPLKDLLFLCQQFRDRLWVASSTPTKQES
jgi:hypothetical protein